MSEGFSIVGIDNLDNYFDPSLKTIHLAAHRDIKTETNAEFEFCEMDLVYRKAIANLFAAVKFDGVINLAEQSGDVPVSFEDLDDLMVDVSLKPDNSIEGGISKFLQWYRECLSFSNDMTTMS